MSKKNITKKIENLFNKLKIKKGDNIFIHSNSAGILQFGNNKDNLNILFEVLKKKIGNKGTIVFPSYNYSILRNKLLNWSKLRSEVGLLSDLMIKNRSFVRTKNPVFSHVIYGKLKKNLLDTNHLTAFENNNNFFQKIIDYKFKIFGFCCPLNKMTLLHYIERQSNVPYRFSKKFKLKIKSQNKYKPMIYEYFVGKKKINYGIREIKVRKLLSSKKKIMFSQLGRFECWVSKSNEVYNCFLNKLKNNKYYLISN
jgi:aminoglycoside 3-N-acetyltransferase